MDELNVQVSLYNRHRNGRYSSYKGTVGKVARNVLHQHFNETVPFKVLHMAVLIIAFGFFKTLFVLIFMAIGITAGYYIQKTGILTNVFK